MTGVIRLFLLPFLLGSMATAILLSLWSTSTTQGLGGTIALAASLLLAVAPFEALGLALLIPVALFASSFPSSRTVRFGAVAIWGSLVGIALVLPF